MAIQNILPRLPRVLLPWYEEYKRDLPWRKDSEPYHIWVSEIMLQQTRVEAVKGYYERFISTLPTISSLAQVDDDLLNKLWEGLGYYSRARNLKKAARLICEKYDGVFPEAYHEIIGLPGIGLYTAGAISSIAFQKPVPAVDGNVLRVFTRLNEEPTPIDKPSFKKQVHDELSKVYPKQAGEFTQALMELGATICVPNGMPFCDRCPCASFCSAFKSGTQLKYPVKAPKRKRKVEDKTVFILHADGAYALEKRPPEGLLAGLWQFPNIPGKLSVEEALSVLEHDGFQIRNVSRTVERDHIFTHIEWKMVGIYLDVAERHGDYVWMSAEEMQRSTAIPTAFRQFLEEISNV